MKVTIPDYPNYYITDRGIITPKGGLPLKWCYRSGRGKHPRVCLYRDTIPKWFSVHRLVAIIFLPNPHNYPIVHHKDNNKDNPFVGNLKWCTNAENIQAAYDDGRISIESKKRSAKKGKDHPVSVPVKITHKKTGEELEFECIRALREFLNQNSTVAIHQAIREPQRTTKGYYVRRI